MEDADGGDDDDEMCVGPMVVAPPLAVKAPTLDIGAPPLAVKLLPPVIEALFDTKGPLPNPLKAPPFTDTAEAPMSTSLPNPDPDPTPDPCPLLLFPLKT